MSFFPMIGKSVVFFSKDWKKLFHLERAGLPPHSKALLAVCIGLVLVATTGYGDAETMSAPRRTIAPTDGIVEFSTMKGGEYLLVP